QEVPPDVDKLSTSLANLARSGKVSGEALRVYGEDLEDLGKAFELAIDPKGIDQVQQSIVSFFGMDSTPVKNAKEDVDAFDKALASMVSGGNADLAAAALDATIKKLREQGRDTDGVREKLDDYKDALAAQALEQQLAAESMGVFGDQALKVQGQLDAQAQSAEGLRQSIMALNDANRSAYDSQIQFEASIDALTDSFKENGATLDLNSEAGRKNGQAMSAAAKAHDEMLAAGLAAGVRGAAGAGRWAGGGGRAGAVRLRRLRGAAGEGRGAGGQSGRDGSERTVHGRGGQGGGGGPRRRGRARLRRRVRRPGS